ncbi:hypothetical protein B0H10DRAFT_1736469, partial [Mycena sp. CBHHK59/15]
RLLSNPNTETCPDFSSDDFADVRKDIGPDDQTAIDKLVASWTKGHDKRKDQWAQKVAAEQAAEDARQKEAEEKAAEAARLAEKERLDVEAKKPKLGSFDENSEAPSFIEARISPFAQRKLEKMEYCVLSPFTPQGLAEAASAALSSSDNISSVRLSQNDDNQLTVQTGPSSTAHKNMLQDDQLSWREFDLGKTRFLKEIIQAGWDQKHCDTLSQFFFHISNHSLREQPNADQILKVYADRTRFAWHQSLGTDNSFNITKINEQLLTKIGDELFNKCREQALTLCVSLYF